MRDKLIEAQYAREAEYGRPLTAAEQAQCFIDALPGMVAPLVWHQSTSEIHHGCIEYAMTETGTYFICDDNDDFTGLYCDFVTIRDAQWFGSARGKSIEIISGVHEDETITLRTAANAHHRARIMSAFTVGGA